MTRPRPVTDWTEADVLAAADRRRLAVARFGRLQAAAGGALRRLGDRRLWLLLCHVGGWALVVAGLAERWGTWVAMAGAGAFLLGIVGFVNVARIALRGMVVYPVKEWGSGRVEETGE